MICCECSTQGQKAIYRLVYNVCFWDISLSLKMDLKRKPIDNRFLNSETGGVFTNCQVCSCSIEGDESEYFIEKVIRVVKSLNLEEVLFEYAICKNCALDLRAQMSEHSMNQMEKFFVEKAKIRQRHWMDLEGEETTKTCLFTGEEVKECSEYSLHAHCIGKDLLLSAFPYAVSDTAMDAMSELLSKETKDELDRFKRKNFNGPPELAELLSSRRFIPI